MEVKVAVVKEVGGKFEIETAHLDDPKHGEVLVKIVAVGVCHTDEHARNGVYKALPFPAVLGHEGAGIIEKVGEGVADFKEGDHVVLSYPYCGRCDSCLQGRPFQCEHLGQLYFGGRMEDGTSRFSQNGKPLSALFNQGAFATHCVVNARSLVKVDPDLDLRFMGPLGCGFQTGAGSVLNVLKPEPASSIVIFGAGSYRISGLHCWTASADLLSDTSLYQSVFQPDQTDNMGSRITGTISVSETEAFVTSIPYDSGFQVLVDGQAVPTSAVNVSFLGFYVSPGTHRVEILYHAPGYRAGILLSGFGVLLWIGLLLGEGLSSRDKKKRLEGWDTLTREIECIA